MKESVDPVVWFLVVAYGSMVGLAVALGLIKLFRMGWVKDRDS